MKTISDDPMYVSLNGRIVPEPDAAISVFDRSFQLGDGLFETIHVFNGHPFRWDQHQDRLERGATFLGIQLPYSRSVLRRHLDQLIAANKLREAMLRLHLSRGIGARGYSPAGAEQPVCVMSLHPCQPIDPPRLAQWKVVTSTLSAQTVSPLNSFKTASKLLQIAARREADAANADEAIILTANGHVLEGAAGNVLWIEGDTVLCVPPDQGALPGITQAVIIEICRKQGITVAEQFATPERVQRSDGCFLTLSSVGIAEIVKWNEQDINQSQTTRVLFKDYLELLKNECSDV